MSNYQVVDINEAIRLNDKRGSHFFSKDTLYFFRSRYSGTGYKLEDGSILFVTSELWPSRGRFYSVRECSPAGDCHTLKGTEFGEFNSSKAAWRWIAKYLKEKE